MDGGQVVVHLKDVPAELAYAWGLEAGTFMRDVASGDADGVHLFYAGNMKMIGMIAEEEGLKVELLGSEDELVRCRIFPKPQGLRIIDGGKR